MSRVSTSAITTSQMNTKTDTQKTTATTAKATNSIQIDTTNEVQQTTTKTKILQTDTALDTSQTTDSVHLTTERGKSYTNYRKRQITQGINDSFRIHVRIASKQNKHDVTNRNVQNKSITLLMLQMYYK